MNKKQAYAAVAVTLAVLAFGASYLNNADLFLRLLLGLGLGFALTKGSIGFAGSVNRAYRRGSTKLIQILMFLFIVTCIINAGLMFNAQPGEYNLWIRPINLGLVVGGILFGAGMSLSSCCASGVMVEMVDDIPRAFITLIFFGAGVFFGMPLQSTQSWIKQSLISTESYAGKGVFLPDLFSWDPMNGYFFSVLLSIAFGLTVIYFARKYQQSCEKNGTYLGVPGEQLRDKVAMEPKPQIEKFWSVESYQRWVGNVWQMRTAALMIAIIVAIMMVATGSGWGASTPYGLWFGKLLMAFGVEPAQIAAFTHKPEAMFTKPVLANPVGLQNLAILAGTLITVLFMGKFTLSLNKGYTLKHYSLFALGGFMMGFGTRFSNGCNVGALFTPVANFSLSGWIFLVVLIAGGILGNRLQAWVLNTQSKKLCVETTKATH